MSVGDGSEGGQVVEDQLIESRQEIGAGAASSERKQWGKKEKRGRRRGGKWWRGGEASAENRDGKKGEVEKVFGEWRE